MRPRSPLFFSIATVDVKLRRHREAVITLHHIRYQYVGDALSVNLLKGWSSTHHLHHLFATSAGNFKCLANTMYMVKLHFGFLLDLVFISTSREEGNAALL